MHKRIAENSAQNQFRRRAYTRREKERDKRREREREEGMEIEATVMVRGGGVVVA